MSLWPPLSPVRLAYAAGLAFAFDASLGLNGPVYPLMYEYIAASRGLRAPARFGVMVALTLSVLAACGVARLVQPLARPAQRYGLAAAFAVAAVIEARPILELAPVWTEPPSVYGALPRDRVTVLADLPFPPAHATWGDEHRFMYFSTFHWHASSMAQAGSLREPIKICASGSTSFRLRPACKRCGSTAWNMSPSTASSSLRRTMCA